MGDAVRVALAAAPDRHCQGQLTGCRAASPRLRSSDPPAPPDTGEGPGRTLAPPLLPRLALRPAPAVLVSRWPLRARPTIGWPGPGRTSDLSTRFRRSCGEAVHRPSPGPCARTAGAGELSAPCYRAVSRPWTRPVDGPAPADGGPRDRAMRRARAPPGARALGRPGDAEGARKNPRAAASCRAWTCVPRLRSCVPRWPLRARPTIGGRGPVAQATCPRVPSMAARLSTVHPRPGCAPGERGLRRRGTERERDRRRRVDTPVARNVADPIAAAAAPARFASVVTLTARAPERPAGLHREPPRRLCSGRS